MFLFKTRRYLRINYTKVYVYLLELVFLHLILRQEKNFLLEMNSAEKLFLILSLPIYQKSTIYIIFLNFVQIRIIKIFLEIILQYLTIILCIMFLIKLC